MVIAPADPVGASAAQRAARAELRGSEYRRQQPGLVTRVVRWIGDRLDSLFSGGIGSHAVLLVLVLVLAVVVVLVVRAGVPRRMVKAGLDGAADPLAPMAARDHRRLAMQLTADGRHAEALREWLRAAVQTIEERGVLPPRPGRTGAATAREAGAMLPAARDDLAAAMAAFDEVWFGGREAGDADVTRARAAADAVTSARVLAGATPDGLAVPW